MAFQDELRSLNFQNTHAWPGWAKVGLATLIIIGCLTAVYFFKVKEQLASRDSAISKEAVLRTTFEEKAKKAASLPAYQEQLEVMRDILRNLLRQLPSKTEMPDLLIDVSQTALQTGIENRLFEPGSEVSKDGFYAEKPISLRMIGTFHQFGQFVSGVASLPRVVILTMHDIQLKPVGNDPGKLELSGTARTYRYLEDDEAATGAAEASASTAQAGAK